jgi:glutamate carboxypeptidase
MDMVISNTAKSIVSSQFDIFVKDLETITNIDSGNGDPEGTDIVARTVGGWLKELGASIEYVRNDRSTHLIARFKGKGTFRLLLIAHIDTVFTKGDAEKRPFRINEANIAYGPGVGDDKATVVQTVYAMKTLKELAFDQYGEIILYYNGEEEGGSSTADQIVEELSQQVDMAIVMDTARPNWGIVAQRKGSANYTITVEGISGHAGNAAQHSASSIMELGNQISLLYKLASPLPPNPTNFTYEKLQAQGIQDHGQYIPANTINVGIIGSTNLKINVIPDNAFVHINGRCYQMAELERLDREIKALPNKTVVPGTKVAVTGGIIIGPMEKTPQVQKMIDLYKETTKREYDVEVVEWLAGGISDGNRSAKNVPTIDALGIENYEEHTGHEYVDLNTVVPRSVVLVEYIRELTAAWPHYKGN